MKKFKIEGCTIYNLNTYSFYTLILSPRRLFNAARAVSSTSFSKRISLKSSTSVTHFFPKNNKVRVKLGIAHQGYFCTFFRGISRTPATSKMELFVTLFNGFQLLTNITKKPHIRCYWSPRSVSIVVYKNIVPKYWYLMYYKLNG